MWFENSHARLQQRDQPNYDFYVTSAMQSLNMIGEDRYSKLLVVGGVYICTSPFAVCNLNVDLQATPGSTRTPAVVLKTLLSFQCKTNGVLQIL